MTVQSINNEEKLQSVLESISEVDQSAREAAKEHILNLAMPPWALGRLLDLAVDIAGIQGKAIPHSGKKRVFTMASDHGVYEEGVSPYPQEVTVQMAQNILLGGAGVNVLAGQSDATVQLVDMGVREDLTGLENSEKLIVAKVADGSENLAAGPAMTREQAIEAVLNAYDIVSGAIENEDVEIVATGELGIGNTTPATAILSVLYGLNPEQTTGRGSGLNDEGLKHKVDVIKRAIEINEPNPNDAIDVLSKVGGYDIAGIVGTILAAAAHRKPVVVDGFISTAGALIASRLNPKTVDYMIPSHCSAEQAHVMMWKELGKEPLLNLDMRLGEGTGAVVAMHLIDCACALMNQMLTFGDAGVSTSDTASKDNFD